MKKVALIALLLLAAPMVLFGADRVVVLEIATGTWCPACPGAANGAEDLVDEHPGRVLVIEYHNADPFANTEANIRNSFNEIQYLPSAVFDGVHMEIGGGPASSSKFFTYNAVYNDRVNIEPPLEISLSQKALALRSTSGTLEAVITNTSSQTVSGKVHFTITESHIPYSWQGLESLHWVERDMLPNAYGEDITLGPGEDVTLTRDYTIDDSWPHFTSDDNIEFGCFVQGSDKEIYQAAVQKYEQTTDAQEIYVPAFHLEIPEIIDELGILKLTLDRPCDPGLVLFNTAGRKVTEIHTGILDAGIHQISLDGSELSTGIYFLRAGTPGHQQVRKLIITR